MNQADALATIKNPSTKHQVDELIKPLMAKYFGWHVDTEGVDAAYESADFDKDGRATGPGRWRALRRFAEEVRKL